ncbi:MULTISPECIES: membrane lipoprotein lipid attachment site-containing protein [unclassified Pseudoalteromonas]|uniref:membrane lipoprotein lipid attachment site-containing protein n=1 Tax=unclassified Pseudoalteromonas TaxID=194690 RepID=UPI00102315BB|nr:membrane lipoprotein lipid attachment site-containing protein [Pseudoalteromonas sp. L1]RZF91970.1 hypothetical protein EXT42_11950 [Pseudoalteromonas sp. CO302Y]RZG08008.1 hypothetical protein EXT40_12740 [Pseudoalteromonas sp. CO133X]WOC27310.1 membrane lipoprotein lipid attachment site-containing protein [Pseudoalteromonas sp. N1230-9]
MKKIVFALFTLLTLSACSTSVPIRNFDSNPIPTVANKSHDLKSIENDILKACMKLGWTCRANQEGKVLGTLDIRKHQLRVEISFNEKEYSIDYKDSINLDYDGKKIHRQYINWVTNLMRNIDAELAYQ